MEASDSWDFFDFKYRLAMLKEKILTMTFFREA